MKKILLSITIILATIMLFGCNKENEKVKIIVPTGTPSLGVSQVYEKEYIEKNIVSGSDSLIAGFVNEEYDIIVAPVNLGVKLYNESKNFKYELYQTITWGNFYIASTKQISSFKELDNKKITVFGKNSAPDILVRTLATYNNITLDIEYVDDVATANSYLMTNKSEIIVSAAPSITKIKNNKSIFTIDLESEWIKISNNLSFPQAAIFVNKDRKNAKLVKEALTIMEDSVKKSSTNKEEIVSYAIKHDESLNKIGKETLLNAIDDCNLRIEDSQIISINFYLEKIKELGLGKTYGEKQPEDDFYYKK